MVLPQVTLDVRAGVVNRWSPALTHGASVKLRVDCPDITLPPLPRPADYDELLRWQALMAESDFEHWCAARLISRETGEVHEPSWGWDLQSWAHDSSILPLGIDAYSIERFPPGAYTLEVRGPGIAPQNRDLTVVAPAMATLCITALRR